MVIAYADKVKDVEEMSKGLSNVHLATQFTFTNDDLLLGSKPHKSSSIRDWLHKRVEGKSHPRGQRVSR